MSRVGLLSAVAPLLLLLALPVHAEWPRHVITPKGDFVDSPAPHSLAYFTSVATWRDATVPNGPAASAPARAERHLVGKLRGAAVYDVFYFFNDGGPPPAKSILVRTGPDSYREIYHNQLYEGQAAASFLVPVGRETLLCVRDNVYRADEQEDCFWMGAHAIVRLDFGPVWRAAQTALPAGQKALASHVMAKSNLPRLMIPVGVMLPDRCCGQGLVEVRFQLQSGRIVILGASFHPHGRFQW